MKHVVRLRKARGSLVPVKRLVTKRGKPFLQTFYMSPDTAPKAPEKPKMIAAPDTKLLPAPKPEWKGPLGDERAYVALTVPGGIRAVRIPESVIHNRFSWGGMDFVTHSSYESSASVYVLDEWRVTEVTTGLKLSHSSTAESAEEAAKRMLENKGIDTLRNSVDVSAKIADLSSEEFTENPKVTERVTDEDIQTLAEHIYTEVLDQGEPEEGDLDEIITWIEETSDYTTRGDVEYALQNMTFDNNLTVELAMRHSMDYEDAESVWADLEKILEYTSEDVETVMDWYDRNYDGSMIDTNLYYLGTASDYGNDWSDAMVVEYALENDVSIETAQSVAEESTEEADEESRSENELKDVYDSQGNLWRAEELEAMVSWMGGNVAVPRGYGRDADQAARNGATPAIHDDIANLFMTKAVEVPYKTLYRGTPNPVWAELEPGQRYECGFASFSKDKEFAGAFHRAKPNEQGYDRFVVVCEAPEGESLLGIDLHDIGHSLVADGFNNETFESYEREEEVTLRAPALEVTRTEDETEGVLKTRYIYVKPADMELVEMLKSRFSTLNGRVWESFNEPLGKPRKPWRKDESDSVPTPES